MNAEAFAKGLEKCRLLTTFLGQNVENLDDYGCPKNQYLVNRWKCYVAMIKKDAYISNEKQLQNHSSTLILKHQVAFFSYQHSTPFTHGLQH